MVKPGFLDPEVRERALEARRNKLTLKQRRFIKEYLRTGSPTKAAKAAYDVADKFAPQLGRQVINNPKVRDTVEEALQKMELTDEFLVRSVHKVIEAGAANTNKALPKDALKGAELIWKLKGRLGNNPNAIGETVKEKAQRMSVTALRKELESLDKRQRLLMDAMKGRAIEGEIVDDEETN